MAAFKTHFDILTHLRHPILQSEELYVLELAMLLLASFPGCHMPYNM